MIYNDGVTKVNYVIRMIYNDGVTKVNSSVCNLHCSQ